MNCDFSSNNNIWASFCSGHFAFGLVIIIMTDLLEFCVFELLQF